MYFTYIFFILYSYEICYGINRTLPEFRFTFEVKKRSLRKEAASVLAQESQSQETMYQLNVLLVYFSAQLKAKKTILDQHKC